jgi:hypothetical protein
MSKQCQIPSDIPHRDKFKLIAASRGMKMKDLFHKIVDELPTWTVVKEE